MGGAVVSKGRPVPETFDVKASFFCEPAIGETLFGVWVAHRPKPTPVIQDHHHFDGFFGRGIAVEDIFETLGEFDVEVVHGLEPSLTKRRRRSCAWGLGPVASSFAVGLRRRSRRLGTARKV